MNPKKICAGVGFLACAFAPSHCLVNHTRKIRRLARRHRQAGLHTASPDAGKALVCPADRVRRDDELLVRNLQQRIVCHMGKQGISATWQSRGFSFPSIEIGSPQGRLRMWHAFGFPSIKTSTSRRFNKMRHIDRTCGRRLSLEDVDGRACDNVVF